jgi:hypothetical protein
LHYTTGGRTTLVFEYQAALADYVAAGGRASCRWKASSEAHRHLQDVQSIHQNFQGWPNSATRAAGTPDLEPGIYVEDGRIYLNRPGSDRPAAVLMKLFWYA